MPPSVLMVLHESPIKPGGGMGVHVHELSLELAKRGWDVTCFGCQQNLYGGHFYTGYDGTHQVSPVEWDYREGFYRTLLCYNHNRHLNVQGQSADIVNLNNYCMNHAMYLHDKQFDLVHLHDHYCHLMAEPCTWWNRRELEKPLPLVMTSHLSFTAVHDHAPHVPFWRFQAQSELNAYQDANELIAVSDAYRRNLEDNLVQAPVTVIPNGIRPETVRRHAPAGSIDGVNGRPVVAFVGRLVPSKGVELLIEASKRMPDVFFVLFARQVITLEGDEHLAKLLKIAESERDNICWLSHFHHHEHWPLYRAVTDMHIVPSLHEPFGIVALEGMALRKPMLVSQVDGLAEFCTEQNSIPFEPSVDGVVGAIRKALSQSPVEREAMLMAADETIKRYNWPDIAAKTEEVYRRALNS